MSKNKIILLFTATVLTLSLGCQKNPTMTGPTNEYSTSSYPTSFDELNSVLTSCYSNLRDQYLYGFDLMPKVLANCTHVANAAYTDGDWGGFINPTALTPSNGFVSGIWQALYVGVKNCNVTLSAADFYQQYYAPKNSTQQINQVRGQAYFLRAYYYFMLENFYGEDYVLNPGAGDTLGVPIFEGSATSLEQAQAPRSSISAVWSLIESDLNNAISLLPSTWDVSNEARVTEWSAKALLGKAYVFRKQYTQALPILQDVINNSGKSLMNYNDYRASFVGVDTLGNPVGKFNSESLFEINVDQNSLGGYGVYSGSANASTINGLIWPPYALGADGTEWASNPLGYGGNDGFHDMNVLRFGFNLGTYNLVTNSNYNGSQPASYTNPAQTMDPAYKAASIAARSNYTVDPRLYVCAMQPWVDSCRYDNKHWYPISRPNYIFGDANLKSEYGWSFRKYAPVYNNVNTPIISSNTGPADASDLFLLRLADVYLLYAEANAGTSNAAVAIEYLNKLRRRAYGLDPNSSSSLDYKSLTGATPAANANDPVLGNNPLYYERWAELFNEGHWWFDICRWHLGSSEAAFYVTARTLSGTPFKWTDNTYAWPIPLTELNTNPKVAGHQNPGY